MVRRYIEVLTDDLDGSDGEVTIPFAVDNTAYEIDLSLDNAEAFRRLLEPYIGAGRRIGSTGSNRRYAKNVRRTPSPAARAAGRTSSPPVPPAVPEVPQREPRDRWLDTAASRGLQPDPQADDGLKVERARIRAWANSNGFVVSERGRIAEHVQQAYRKAMGNTAVPKPEPPPQPGPRPAAHRANGVHQRGETPQVVFHPVA